jgi:hypothetical protein
LQAVTSQNPSLLQQPIELQEWLDFLAKAHHKQPKDIEALKTTELKEAYHLVEMDSWDEKLKVEYREHQAKRYNNISHYVEGEILQARQEEELQAKGEILQARQEDKLQARQQTALRLIDFGLKDQDVLWLTFLSPEELGKIKRDNNK